ncbi:hypothetical protein [uncultured Treponema sp.]|uniref:hypothetical protein n=1 Tax=uncultured Treponema sp. TaxID=162155 RepID=UPI002587E3A1|nr:hypothetical protein [uncultured Treponema sp.]
MKKMLKLAAVLVALFAMTNFIACSDGGSSSSSGGGLTIPLMEAQPASMVMLESIIL